MFGSSGLLCVLLTDHLCRTFAGERLVLRSLRFIRDVLTYDFEYSSPTNELVECDSIFL